MRGAVPPAPSSQTLEELSWVAEAGPEGGGRGYTASPL